MLMLFQLGRPRPEAALRFQRIGFAKSAHGNRRVPSPSVIIFIRIVLLVVVLVGGFAIPSVMPAVVGCRGDSAVRAGDAVSLIYKGELVTDAAGRRCLMPVGGDALVIVSHGARMAHALRQQTVDPMCGNVLVCRIRLCSRLAHSHPRSYCMRLLKMFHVSSFRFDVFFFYCRFDVLSGQNRVVVDTVEGKNG